MEYSNLKRHFKHIRDFVEIKYVTPLGLVNPKVTPYIEHLSLKSFSVKIYSFGMKKIKVK